MSVAVLSIGSNVGDRLEHLRSVVRRAGDWLVAASGVYQTAPWGGVPQEAFLNAVVIVSSDAVDPAGWLEFAHECEQAAHRTRELHWGPRTLDVDIVAAYDDRGAQLRSDDPTLTLPHPRAHERAFVLAPWHEVDPDAVLPHGPVSSLLDALRASGDPEQAIERTALELT